jgi:hypothetical protein
MTQTQTGHKSEGRSEEAAGTHRPSPPDTVTPSNSNSSRSIRTSPRRQAAPSTSSQTIGHSNHSQHKKYNGSPSASPRHPAATPTKLRRKVTVEQDSFDNAVSAQRLVEYFLVISCHPRWESAFPYALASTSTTPTDANSNGLSTPQPKRPPALKQRAVSSPISTTRQEQDDATDDDSLCGTSSTFTPKATTKTLISPLRKGKMIGKSISNAFRKRDKHGPGNAVSTGDMTMANIQTSQDLSESRDETVPSTNSPVPPPRPRETWKREDKQEGGHEENIHVPQATAGDSHTFAPKVTARFPLEDYSDHPLNPMVTQFCFPAGEIILPSEEYHMPSVHHFVLTNDRGKKVYGTCLTIHEEYHPAKNTPWENTEKIHSATVGEAGIEVSVNPEPTTLYVPRCLCILSIWPYMTAFREYLAQLYRLATGTDCMKAPIERYILNICLEIPAPPPGAFEVQMNILDSVIRFWSPPAKLPIAYVALPYQILFDCLDVENILHLWYCLTMERKVLLVSSQHSILTVCSEILCSLLYPMKWSHLYVPLLPKFLCPILDAPGKFMIVKKSPPFSCGVSL